MELIIRAVDVGYGNTKYVAGISGDDIRCASFPSLAYPFPRDPSATLGADRRKTVAIPIGGMFYEVGPDVMLAADAFRATQIHDNFIDTPEYLALARGALRMMKVDTIDLLVVGLPVAMFALKKAALEKLMTGTHDVGNGKTVLVRKALAMAQPNGALIDYASQHDKVVAMESEHSLVIDPGSRTFDWLVARGMKLSHKRSHSVNRGVSDILQVIADDISAEIGRPYNQLDAIDLALRTNKNLAIFQRTYSLARMKPVVESVTKQAVGAMMRRIGEFYDVQHVILVGGGAFLFKKAVKEAFATHQILEVKEPMFSNLRGYQIAGTNYAATVMEASSRLIRVARLEGEGA
ncbi:PRTRC system protein D [Rhodoferax sp. UBA5149]|uniref:PRTRC system protein D n=1 Tax=Rhodoferax sp. UBA5149 TaxID=1947379 RepID=UPI0025D5DAE9|nr:PRTRC system protein D [Rhodoferax sp. UBA5149]